MSETGTTAADSLRQRTVQGLGWSGLAQGLRQFIQAIVTIVLARLLAPSEFGLLGMTLVFTGFAQVFTDFGLGAALVQRRELSPAHLGAASALQLGMGALFAALLAAVAPLVSAFYQEPRLVPVCLALAPNFLLLAMSGVPMAMLQKAMDFRRTARIEALAALLSGTAAVVLAWLGWGVWSLVAQTLIGSLVTLALARRGSSRPPRPAVDRAALRELLGFSLPLTGFNALNYWIRNLDNLIVGKFIGPAALGLYSRAYNLMLFPVYQLSTAATRVMFPALSSIQEQTERVRNAYLGATRLIALAAFPLLAGMGVLADLIIVTLFGPVWSGAAPVLRILCLVGLLQSVGTTLGWIYTARGRTDIMMRIGLLAAIANTVAFLVGVRWGIRGVAAAYAASNTALHVVSWIVAGRLVGLRYPRMAGNVAGALACAVAMAAGVHAARSLLLPGSGWLPLLALTGGGAALYALLVHVCRLRAWREFRALLGERLAAWRQAGRDRMSAT